MDDALSDFRGSQPRLRCAGCLLPVELACRVQLSEWGGSMCVLCKVCYDVFQSVHNFMTCMCLVCTSGAPASNADFERAVKLLLQMRALFHDHK